MTTTATTYSPGLEGVIAGETAISTVEGGLRYRGYPVGELAEHCSFDEVAYLLLHGELPTAKQLKAVPEPRRRRPPAAAAAQATCSRRCRSGRRRWTRCAPPSACWPTSTRTRPTTRTTPTCARPSGCSPRSRSPSPTTTASAKGLQPVAGAAGPGARGQLPLHAPRRRGDAGRSEGARRVADPVRRARVQRLARSRPA